MQITTTVLTDGDDLDRLLDDCALEPGSWAFDEYCRRWYVWSDASGETWATYPGAGADPRAAFTDSTVTLRLEELPMPVTVVEVSP